MEKKYGKTLGGSISEEATTIIANSDGSYAVAGRTQSNDKDAVGSHSTIGNSDFWLIKVDEKGNKLWQKTYGGSQEDIPYSMISTNDNSYLIVGQTFSTDGDTVGNHGF